MGEFSMQIFYLFVYIIVFCESLPVVKEKTTTKVYDDDKIKEINNDKLLSDIVEKHTTIGLSKLDIINKLQPSFLRNISRELIENIKHFTDNVITYIKNSVSLHTNQIEEFKMTHGNEDRNSVRNKSLKSAPNEKHSNTMVVDNVKLTNTEYSTSPLLDLGNSKVAPGRLKNKRRVPGHRKYRQKRSDWWSIGFGLDTGFGDDSDDVIFGAHTSPCAHADRHYCLNGGTCVFLGALEIKTCRFMMQGIYLHATMVMLVVFVYSSLVTQGCLAQSLIISPIPATVVENQDIVLQCFVKHNGTCPVLEWQRNDQPYLAVMNISGVCASVTERSEYAFGCSPTGGNICTYTLTIENIQLQQTGDKWKCMAVSTESAYTEIEVIAPRMKE